MDLELKNKVVVVTGGAKGIGEGIALAFAEEGALVAALDRDEPTLRRLAHRAVAEGWSLTGFPLDLRDESAVSAAFGEIERRFGGIDILVNNAGGNDAVGLHHSPAEFVASLERNLVHYFTCAHFALPALKKSRGAIVNISSKTALTGQGGTSGYAAAKGAINGLTREWAADLAQHGIRVNCVLPAEVITPMYEQWLAKAPDPAAARRQLDLTIPLGRRTTTIREVADLVVFVASSRASHLTGQILCVDGGYIHLDRALTAPVTHLKKSE